MSKNLNRPRWEMADIVRRFGEDFSAHNRLTFSHLRVMRHIRECRTSALGGHMEKCDSCGHERPVYNSCRDRHCPKCQALTKEKWLKARKAELLPVEYFHSVFTLPHELNPLIIRNKRVLLKVLFQSVSETLLKFGRDKRSRLGGLVGFTLILHTWNQKLLNHFHLHCVIPAGALSFDENRWIKPRNPGFLFSVKALGLVFRSKYLEHLKQAYEDDKLKFSGVVEPLKDPVCFGELIKSLRSKQWVVYSKAPFGGPEKVLDYLGRYTHRVAISNNRILDVDGERVTFSYRDRSDGNKKKACTTTGLEFMRRFLLHILPRGFSRIRHYGFLANRKKKEHLGRCRELLGAEIPSPTTKQTPEQLLLQVTGIDILKCPCCGNGRMNKVRCLSPAPLRLYDRRVALCDTS